MFGEQGQLTVLPLTGCCPAVESDTTWVGRNQPPGVWRQSQFSRLLL